ncbi:phosphoserine phosphatase [Candidatus Francisella endociliophora]|uniref:phosphoserine phosphatase n=1 Tax=Candidatus Francisella endociliophora TaxID=653937 RepID=A0A097ERG1_9GAMM|nr:HAD-IB family phosphatase [Francisella sp. FSC1006]AIT10144.1 phosphoserine phosphatase [Francisella sp. FSC1006]
MRNIIFDFDSTLIKKESLEIILEPLLKESPEKIFEIEKITNLGMQGDLDFRESLEKRLAMASPTKQSIKDFADKYCPDILTDGIAELIKQLKSNGDNIWIFSGGIAESIEPFADYLQIPRENIFAVEVNWDNEGNFDCLDNSNGACDSKLVAFEKVKNRFEGEVIAIGDGYTDYQLFEKGVADKFIAYVEHVERKNVLDKAESVAMDVGVLKYLLI